MLDILIPQGLRDTAFFVCIYLLTICRNFLLDKMKQYLEQLRKECSDRMVDRVIDPETDKPSKVKKRDICFHLKICV